MIGLLLAAQLSTASVDKMFDDLLWVRAVRQAVATQVSSCLVYERASEASGELQKIIVSRQLVMDSQALVAENGGDPFYALKDQDLVKAQRLQIDMETQASKSQMDCRRRR